jgi:hypothetical protein
MTTALAMRFRCSTKLNGIIKADTVIVGVFPAVVYLTPIYLAPSPMVVGGIGMTT